MTSLLNFFVLKGYGQYVWPAYGLVFGFLAVQLFLPWWHFRKFNQEKKGPHAQAQ